MRTIGIIINCFFFSLGIFAQDASWKTFYERSDYKKTPRYLETMDFCWALAGASPMVHMETFGKSAQGRDMEMIIVDRDGLADPARIHASGRVLVLVQACIHPGESEGKDAMLMMVRDMVIKKQFPGLLDQVSILFIPIFNVDGHERFGPYNRINQNGPEEMGWRVTANNLNLNRDYLKADTPEMEAWLCMFDKWMPDFFIDTHTTDGADYQYALTYLVEVFGDMDPGLTRWARESYIPGLESAMNKDGILIFPYVDFRNWHDPRSGLISEVAPPMLSQGYTALRNRPGLLIETHMLKDYKTRVDATYHCILVTLNILSKDRRTYLELVRNADEWLLSPAFRETRFPLQFQTAENDSAMVDFLGYSYTMEKSAITGGYWFRYSHEPEVMKIPYFSKTHPTFSVMLPAAYIIPPEWATVIARLGNHGIKMKQLAADTRITVSSYRFRNPKWQANPYEGRHPMTQIEYDEITEERVFPAGSVIVEVSQQAGRIIPHILEPKGNGSYVYWGFFDAIFEQKEYAENYVVEKMAARMLSEDPSLKAEFDRKISQDTLFAKSPQQILAWFYSRSPYADPRRLVYPVGRIMDESVVRSLKTE